MKISEKLLKKIQAHPSFSHVKDDALILKMNPTSAQLEEGAFKWVISGYNIGSSFTMSECLKSNDWGLIKSQSGDIEILP